MGLGAPLGALVSEPTDRSGHTEDGVLTGVRVPVTALLRFDTSEAMPWAGGYNAALSVIDYTSGSSVEIDDQTVPLETEPTAALALTLTENPPWQTELKVSFRETWPWDGWES